MKAFLRLNSFADVRQFMIRGLVVICTLATFSTAEPTDTANATTLHNSLTQPQIVTEGTDVLLTCVAKDVGDNTVIWKFGRDKILTAGSKRISSDKRFEVLRDEGGDVYVLSISNTTHRDSGLYTCEVNSDPPARSFHKLTVLSDKLVAPSIDLSSLEIVDTADSSNDNSSTASIAVWGFSTPLPIDHDYTDCCNQEGVSSNCIGFCNIKNILEGTTGIHPSECEDQFKKIVRCMADGKNHSPCCEQAGIPDVCQDMCIGEYTEQTDDVRSHISCSAYTAPTLACIAEGVDILPPRPTEVEVEDVSDHEMLLKWSMPSGYHAKPENFQINVTKIRKFVSAGEGFLTNENNEETNSTKTYTISGDKRTLTLTNLEPFTYYSVVMRSENKHGQSLPSYKLKVLTLSASEVGKENPRKSTNKIPLTPSLPDVKECCTAGKISHKSCIDNFCDPLSVKSVTVPDLMICAPWSETMFGCLANGIDHTECCDARGVPDICAPICSGNATSVNFKHFRCIEYMHEISNCVLRGYGVLPSEPRNFRFSNVGHNIGLLHWDKPDKLSETITSYTVTYLRIAPNEPTVPKVVEGIKETTFIIEDLVPNSSYEVYVEALNAHGVGDPSTRIVFRTAMEALSKPEFTGYDPMACCEAGGVINECLPLCQYNISITLIQNLSEKCSNQFAKITKCAAGGRDHLPCCLKRGVPDSCQAICQGLQVDSKSSIFTSCSGYIGNIMLCLEEGVDTIPPPVKDFHALYVSDNSVELAWEPIIAADNRTAVDQYEIYFKELNNNSDSGSHFDHNNNINTTRPLFTVMGLKTDAKYRFFVVARNSFGTSLPSAVVTVNVSQAAWDGSKINGLPSPPHAIEVSQAGADYLSFTWTAPTISDHYEVYKYRLYYGVASNSTKDTMIAVETTASSVKLNNLSPNTPYVIYMTTVNDKGEGEPSETIVTWTDPIVPAYAEAPTVHPRTGLVEGGTMTVLCIALGTPTPKITFYLGGHAIRSETSRHLVTTIYNITKDMSTVSCYADNGYGTPVQTSRTVEIEHKPYVKGPGTSKIVRYVGQDVSVLCTVDANPSPVMTVGRIGGYLTTDDRIQMVTQTPRQNRDNMYAVGLNITSLKMEDSGNYYCKGNNTHGDETKNFEIVVLEASHSDGDIMACCKEQNVTEECLGICSVHQLDLDLLLYSPQCIPELDKLMVCGSDGSDHRHCCSQSDVPRSCLDWCRGQPVEESESCALSFAPQIGQCFHEGQYTLPGPPRNIKVTPMNAHSAVASWDPPNKNPETVELYRILWRQEGARLAKKIDTSETTVSLEDLVPGVTYELVVKAGNANGTSQLTPPIKFITADKYIIEAKVYTDATPVIGALVAVFLLIILVGVAVWYVKGRKNNFMTIFLRTSNDNGFTNPIVSQEVTMSTLQQSDHADAEVHPEPAAPEQSQTEEEPRRGVLSKLGIQNSGFNFQRFS